MPCILIIEPSATHRYSIKRMLGETGEEVIEAADCHQAIARLTYLAGSERQPGAIILGWPRQASIFFHELVALLCQPPHEKLPLLVLTQETLPATDIGLAERCCTSLYSWDLLEQAVEDLQQMLSGRASSMLPYDASSDLPIRLLLVDDSKTIRAQFGSMLRKQGYLVDVAESPAQALEMAHNDIYDIAIIDYYMPQMNGAELCRTFKQKHSTEHIELAVLTGSYSDTLVADVLDSGALECMFKNESMKLFLARVQAMARMCAQKKRVCYDRLQLNNILGAVGDGVYGVDLEGRLTFANPAAMRMLGYQQQDLLGKTAHALFHHSDAAGRPVATEHCFLHQAYKLGDRLEKWDSTFWNSQGSPIPVECTLTPLLHDGVLGGSVVAFRDISERLLFEEELKWQVNHDHLTQLPNRQFLEQSLQQEINNLVRSKGSSALLFIDLDRFKQINDTAGHAAGDQLLIEVSGKLKSCARESDIVARVSGDEFAVILHAVDVTQVEELADRFRQILHLSTFHYAGRDFDVTGSIGVALFDGTTLSSERVLANADSACHLAKSKGRNKVHIFQQGEQASEFGDFEKGWIERLKFALEQDLFQLAFQPVYRMHDLPDLEEDGTEASAIADPGCCEFYEVLIRLQGNDGEMILPGAFLPSAERFGLIWDIDRWVLRRTAHMIQQANSRGQRLRLSVNVTDQTLLHSAFLNMLSGVLARFDIQPGSLLVELKETRMVSNFHQVQMRIRELADMGVDMVLDEFGRGYSSFSHLQHLDAPYVKINGSFVQGMSMDPIDKAMVSTINDVARVLNRKTIAQHVETPHAYQMLKQMKVDLVQGNFLHVPVADLDALVSMHSRCVECN